jgi:hypothetical protein
MKCQVILDKKGKIVTFGYMDQPELEENEEAPTLRSGPVAEKNQTLVELDMPEEYIRMPTADFIQRLQIDIRAKGVKPTIRKKGR